MNATVAIDSRSSGRWRAEEPEEDGQQEEFLTFDLANEIFAVNVNQVREVLDLRHIVPLANAPSALLGIIDVRGVSVPVIDLKQKLGLTRGEPSDHTRIVILQVQGDDGDMVVGALADAVYEVTQLAHEGIEAPPRTGTAWDQSFMMGIARRQGRFVTVLDLDRVFSQASFDFPHHG